MWSKSGISAVDMSASYYFNDGYWNGNVWMSHQWFLWKTMFDLGEADFAFEIAKRALDMWKAETDFRIAHMNASASKLSAAAGSIISAAFPLPFAFGQMLIISRAR